MLVELQTLHEEITQEGARLDIAIEAPRPSLACVAATRWKLYSLARTRQGLVQEKIIPCLRTRVMSDDLAKLDDLGRELELSVAKMSRHVSVWSISTVQHDWAGYCAAASEVRKEMRQQITADTLTLIPLLRRYSSGLESIVSAWGSVQG